MFVEVGGVLCGALGSFDHAVPDWYPRSVVVVVPYHMNTPLMEEWRLP